MILNRIRVETKAAHQALEVVVIPRIKSADREGYIKLLQHFYGYFKPVEDLLDVYMNDKLVPEYSERRKAGALLADLEVMGGIDKEPRRSTNLPAITNEYQAIGAMYVLEGSTLGGKIISKMLMQRLGKEDNNGIAFFSGYGEHTDAMWASFTNTLDNYTADKEKQDEIVNTATQTFSLFEQWMRANAGV